MNESSDFDPVDEELYRSYSTWQLEQLRREFQAERESGQSVTGHKRRLPDGYYDTRITLIDALLMERNP